MIPCGAHKNILQRHPGFDVYSLFWLVLFLILAALGRFYLPLFLPAAVVLVYLLIRLFSKNQQKRQVENARFIALFRSIFRWFRGRKVLQTDKEYYYFKCPPAVSPCACPGDWARWRSPAGPAPSRFETKS